MKQVGTLMLGVVVLVIAFAGLAKSAQLDAFATALRSWVLLPESVRAFLIVSVPLFEVSVGALWLMGCRSLMPLVVLVYLAIATAIYVTHLVVGIPADCGCFAKIAVFKELERSAPLVLLRNAVMMMMNVPSVVQRHFSGVRKA
ncbi:MAG: MauE/DoxX family redox-associated membrane protein [Phycisphaerales bacterium]